MPWPDGIPNPPLMYGTAWKGEATMDLTVRAVRAGFRAIDTANQARHYSEALVGEALRRLTREGIGRDDLFLQTKFTSRLGQDHRLPYDPRASLTDQVKQSFASSLEHLDTDRLDAYLLHGPHRRFGLGPDDWEVWRAIEGLHGEGRIGAIGVSNVNLEQLVELVENAARKPMVVQNRCYAVLGWDRDVRRYCRDQGLVYQGFSLLTANLPALELPAVTGPAARLQRTPAQIVFRFAHQVGMLPLTGTSDEGHMRDDLAITGFDLTAAEVAAIEAISG